MLVDFYDFDMIRKLSKLYVTLFGPHNHRLFGTESYPLIFISFRGLKIKGNTTEIGMVLNQYY